MIKADTREAKLVSVIEVQSSEGAKEAPEAADADNKQRQDAWVKVCVREALGEFWLLYIFGGGRREADH